MKVIVILGPTCVGKTKMSVELAKLFNGEVINADSTQVYKDLNIATAKTTVEEKENIIHHLFDIRNINEDYTVFDYQKDARDIIDDIIKRDKTPILCGGTGLYIKACLYDYQFNFQTYKGNYDKYTNLELYEMLKKYDSKTEIHINNRKRIERALDYYHDNKELLSDKKSDKLLYDAIFIGLTTSRDILYDRINQRVDKMVNNGLLDEAKWVYNTNVRSKAVLTPIGYKELFSYFENTEKLESCIDKIKQNSRRYAKRQYTWFNNQMNVKWFDVNFTDFNQTVDIVKEYIKKESNII